MSVAKIKENIVCVRTRGTFASWSKSCFMSRGMWLNMYSRNVERFCCQAQQDLDPERSGGGRVLGEKGTAEARDEAQVVVGRETGEAAGAKVELLFLINGLELGAGTVLFGQLADLGELLAKGMRLLDGDGRRRGGRRDLLASG